MPESSDQSSEISRKQRILVLTSTFPRWESDTEPRFVLDLSKNLSTCADVLVLAPHASGARLEESLEGVSVRRYSYFFGFCESLAYEGGIMANLRSNRLRILLLPFFLLSLACAARRAIREWSPDVIHAHWIIPQALVACIAARSTVPILCTVHGGDLHGLRGRFMRMVKAWVLRKCDRICVVSSSMVEAVNALAPDADVDTVPMGTDLRNLFVPPPLGHERKANQLVFVGRLVEKKGLAYLLDALKQLSDTGVQLKIIGDGPLRKELQERAFELGVSDRVRFEGGVSHNQLGEWLRDATIAVFPFVVASDGDQEGFGLVITEAMGCACPVIASDLPAVRDSIEPGITGLLIPPEDSAALAEAIESLLANAVLRRRLAEAALVTARSRFDWSSISARYLDIMGRMSEAG